LINQKTGGGKDFRRCSSSDEHPNEPVKSSQAGGKKESRISLADRNDGTVRGKVERRE